MPWTETLPSGLYRARYRLPDGSKRTVKDHNQTPIAFTHKKKAYAAAAVAEEEAATVGWRDPAAAMKTWGEWCADWWPTRGVEPGVLKRDASSRDSSLLPKWGKTPLAHITRFDVKAWAGELAAAGMAPATVKKRLYLLSASLNAAIDAEILSVNPAYKIELPGGQTDRRRYLTFEEADYLMAQFRPPVRANFSEDFVPTLFGTGQRFGEAAGLQISRVDFKRMKIRIAETWDDEMRRLKAYPKGKKIREVPILDWVEPHLRNAIGKRKTGFVFFPNGHPIDYSNWRYRVWEPATERAHMPEVTLHDTRHSYASWLLSSGKVSLAEVGALLGHTSPQTTAIYAHLLPTPQDNIHAALTSPFAKPAPDLPQQGLERAS